MHKAVIFDFFGVLYTSLTLFAPAKINTKLLAFGQSLRPRYKLGLLTNMNKGVLNTYFTQDEVAQYFDAVVVSGEVGFVKPQHEMYQLIAERLGVAPNECVFVDDIQTYCEAAEQVGMRAILYTSTEQVIGDIKKEISM